jgi:hypothetical protein
VGQPPLVETSNPQRQDEEKGGLNRQCPSSDTHSDDLVPVGSKVQGVELQKIPRGLHSCARTVAEVSDDVVALSNLGANGPLLVPLDAQPERGEAYNHETRGLNASQPGDYHVIERALAEAPPLRQAPRRAQRLFQMRH